MMTREELIAQCKAENPKMFQTINDEVFELIGADYENACEDWADYQIRVKEIELERAEAAAKRQALLDKLGITEDEAKLLLG